MIATRRALVCGGGGFIGNDLVRRLKRDGFKVRAIDFKRPPYSKSAADEFFIGDLRDAAVCRDDDPHRNFDEVYQLAADMGGAGYIFTGENDADIMRNSAAINLNVLAACSQLRIGKFVLFVFGLRLSDPGIRGTRTTRTVEEGSAYPADPG